jgi:hypothetical protein
MLDYLNTEEEVVVKEEIWNQLNKDYLEAEKEKEREKASQPSVVPTVPKQRVSNLPNFH